MATASAQVWTRRPFSRWCLSFAHMTLDHVSDLIAPEPEGADLIRTLAVATVEGHLEDPKASSREKMCFT